MSKIEVVQDEKEPVSTKILAQAIVDISKAAKILLQSGLNRKAIIVLIHAACPSVGKREIDDVLTTLESLRSIYCTGGR